MRDANSDVREVRLSVPSMDCASCAETVERRVSTVDGVRSVDPLPAAGTVVVSYDSGSTSEATVVSAIEDAGYTVDVTGGAVHRSPHEIWRSRRAIATWFGAVLLAVGIVTEFLAPVANPAIASIAGYDISPAWLAYLGAVGVAGVPVVRGGYASFRGRDLDVDLLMSVGILAALAVGLPFEAATLAVLFSVAELLERFSMDRARASLRDLVDLAPDVATVLVDGEERTVRAEDVDVGDVVAVRPGERVPVDGVVTDGASALDESPVTGESVPAEKAPGDEVYAGSIVDGGYVELRATATAGESTLARVIELVEDAERAKTDRERFIDRFARHYTPVVVAGAVLTVPASMVAFDVSFQAAFVRGLTLLVIACPCALVISTPVSVVSGVTAAARNGVLVKGGDKLEAAGAVDVVAFDKTGTLTTGELGVTDVIPLDGTDEETVLRVAATVERRSEHPISRAIVAASGAAADGDGIIDGTDGADSTDGSDASDGDPTVTDFETLPGAGVRADVDGTTYLVGKPALFESMGFELGVDPVETDGGASSSVAIETEGRVDGATVRLQTEGKTVVLVGTTEELVGLIAVADSPRPEAARAVARLHELGVETVMLTGDNDRTARSIADRLGIDEVRAGLLPDEKVDAVRELTAAGGTVAMVGDGVNDAPALAAADVGIAMGAAGTDAAIETADVALLGDDLLKLPYLCRLARRASRVIRQNVWSSLGVKAVLAMGAPLGLVSVVAAIVVGDMGMSLAVTGNALRLAGIDPEA